MVPVRTSSRPVPPSRVRNRAARATAAFLLAVTAAACTREASAPQLEPETYVDVMVALRRAHRQTASAAEFQTRREQILREAGVTDSLLVEWVRTRGTDVELLASLWDSINARLASDVDSAR